MVPRMLGALVAVAGGAAVLLAILVGELASVGWPLVKGVDPRKAPLSGR